MKNTELSERLLSIRRHTIKYIRLTCLTDPVRPELSIPFKPCGNVTRISRQLPACPDF